MSTALKIDKFLNNFFKLSLKESDSELYNSVKDEFIRQQNHIELIASENIVSKAVLEARVQYSQINMQKVILEKDIAEDVNM